MDKPLVWLHAKVKSPPLSPAARLRIGELLRELQRGTVLEMPLSRPMPGIGRGCHELRIRDRDAEWRLIYRIDDDAIVIAEVLAKRTQKTPGRVIEVVQRRLRAYDAVSRGEG